MATLSDIASTVADLVRRPSDADILAKAKTEVANTIRHFNRRASWLLERREVSVTLSAGTNFYSTVDTSSSQGWSDSASGTSGGTATTSILKVHHARLELGAIDWPLTELTLVDFENLLEQNTVSGTPRYFTVAVGRIGFWPTPNGAFTVRILAMFQPGIPSADTDESVWFDQNPELIEASAARRVAQKWLHDAELTQILMASEREQETQLFCEGALRRASGRARSHD